MPALTRDLLARTALQLIDDEGLARLSMRALAARLGVDPMAAYRHVANKEALLDAVMDALLDQVGVDGLEPGEAGLRELCRRLLDTMTRHPEAAGLLATRPWTTPSGMAIAELALELAEPLAAPEALAPALNATGLFLGALARAIHADANRSQQPVEVSPDHPRLAGLAAGGGPGVDYHRQLDWWLDAAIAQLHR